MRGLLRLPPSLLACIASSLLFCTADGFLPSPSGGLLSLKGSHLSLSPCTMSSAMLSAPLVSPSVPLSNDNPNPYDEGILSSSPLLPSSLLLSETEAWVAPVALGGDIFLNLLSFLMLWCVGYTRFLRVVYC